MTGGFPDERYDPGVSNVSASQPVPPPWPAVAPPARQPSRWLALVSLGIALLAVGFAIAAWLRPAPKYQPPPAPTYSSQQVADAKAKVCAAYERVHSAITASSARDMGSDATSQLAFALNGRQALIAGSEYLRTVLSSQPATPAGLAAMVRRLTDTYQELTIDYLNGLTETQMQTPLQTGNDAALSIENSCK